MSTTKMSKRFSFRAGIATFDEETKMCHPQPMQGTITISPSGQDDEMVDDADDDDDEMGFWDFQWSTRDRSASGHTSDPIQLILIPGETAWVHVKSCPDARVFALVFSSNEKYFFWLQEKNPVGLALNELSDKDKSIYEKIVALLNPGPDDDDEQSRDSNDKTPEQEDDNEQNNDVIMADAAA